jgi:hypothetical protein
MNILDENLPESQRQLLRSWRIPIRQIGIELGHQGMRDEEIVPLLHQLRHPTFFTRDFGFYNHRLCHAGYCIVYLAVGQYEAASFIRGFLRHLTFNTQAKRAGAVIRVSPTGLRVWHLYADKEEKVEWCIP